MRSSRTTLFHNLKNRIDVHIERHGRRRQARFAEKTRREKTDIAAIEYALGDP